MLGNSRAWQNNHNINNLQFALESRDKRWQTSTFLIVIVTQIFRQYLIQRGQRIPGGETLLYSKAKRKRSDTQKGCGKSNLINFCGWTEGF